MSTLSLHVVIRCAVVNDETVDSPSLAVSEISTCQADYCCYLHKTMSCIGKMEYLIV